jgi:hypothetical protein
MEKTRTLNAKGLGVRAGLAAAVVIITLGLCGCGNELARMQENQLVLQEILEANAEQIAAIRTCIERNQEDVLDRMERLKTSVQGAEVEIAALRNKQLNLEEMAQKNNGLLVNKIDKLGQNQQSLKAEIDTVGSDTQNLAVEIVALTNEQVKLQQMAANHEQELNRKIEVIQKNQTVIEKNQGTWQGQVKGLLDNTQKVGTSVGALEQNLVRLQGLLQNDIRNLLAAINANSQEHIQHNLKVQESMQGLLDSIGAMRQTQTILQKQIEDVQNNTQMISDNMMAASEQPVPEPTQTHPNAPTISEAVEVESLVRAGED